MFKIKDGYKLKLQSLKPWNYLVAQNLIEKQRIEKSTKSWSGQSSFSPM